MNAISTKQMRAIIQRNNQTKTIELEQESKREDIKKLTERPPGALNVWIGSLGLILILKLLRTENILLSVAEECINDRS